MSKHTPFLERLPAYVLGCLEEDEAQEVSDHLAVCPACRAEWLAYQEVVGDLALAVPQTEPPAALKGRLMAHLSARPSPTTAAAPSLPWWERLRRLLQGAAPLWAPVSLLLIVSLALLNLLLWQRLSRLERMASAPEMRIVALVGTEAAPEAHGIVVITGDGEYGSLIVEKLPPLSPEKQYQLWLIRDGQRTSGGVFSVTPDGYGVMAISSPRPLLEYSAFGITIEPAGGSPGPTGAKVLGGSL
ncbi:MAG TPA: hypothetical protein ENK56_04450 [Chloroflexi bacterium]|nr:hypothetical protein [Chloroflexota bacterium]